MTTKAHKKHSQLVKPDESLRSGETDARLYGLVLAGGKSERMGRDKGAIEFHGKPQREHMADLLNSQCERVYLSTRPGQEMESAFVLLPDTFLDLGPYGGILSAFRHEPNAAWLTVATDVPLVSAETLAYLIQHRDHTKIATCFHNPETDFPEPLITIWEPAAYPVLLAYLGKGLSCPRKVLINEEVKELAIPEAHILANVNTPEDLERISAMLEKK